MSSAGDDEAPAGRLLGPGWDWGEALSGGGRSVAVENGPTVLRPRLHAPVRDLRPSRFGTRRSGRGGVALGARGPMLLVTPGRIGPRRWCGTHRRTFSKGGGGRVHGAQRPGAR